MDISTLDIESVRKLTDTLIKVLDSRLHRRVHMGETIWVKGSLSQALKLPDIRRRLHMQSEARQQQAKNSLNHVWHSLSDTTRDNVLKELEWYAPEHLDWDDPRSNRRPFPPTK